jgi:hypothetical protein
MKWIAPLVLTAALLCGCGKRDAASSTPKASTNTAVNPAGSPAPLAGVVDPSLTLALKAFVREKGRLPQDMFELKSAKLDSVPRPPAGFTYAIDPVTVEVKLVKL